MPKFRVGDTVRILPRKAGQGHHRPQYTDRMQDYSGCLGTVSGFTISGSIKFADEPLSFFCWHEDWLEPVKKRKFL